MSTYSKITRHPLTGKWEYALWIDDYFGHHEYGVSFPSDNKTFPVNLVQPKQIREMWTMDILAGFIAFLYGKEVSMDVHEAAVDDLTKFLNLIEDEYKDRWKRDPKGGEGALAHYQEKYGKSRQANTN